MYFFNIQAIPKPETEKSGGVAGAYVQCWINFVLQDGAELLARYYIEQSGWIPGEKEDERWVEEEDYADEPQLLEYYREATEDGACFVYHTWPDGAEGDDSDEGRA
jgi:hypothetical protein